MVGSLLQEPINAVFDKAVLGNKVVMADILEADQSGNLPSNNPFTHRGGSAISNLMKQPKLVSLFASLAPCTCVRTASVQPPTLPHLQCKALAGHSALKTYANYKWKQYAGFYYW